MNTAETRDTTLAASKIKELSDKGYDKAATWRYARAAKSWCVKDSHDWQTWDDVVKMTAPA